MIRALSAALLAFVCLTAVTAAPAQARKVHHTVAYDNDGHIFGGTTSRAYRTQGYRASTRGADRIERVAVRRGRGIRNAGVVADGRGTIIGGRPSGCPHQYCGCGTSIKIFGRIRPELNLASNWLRKFPRTAAAPGMAAARAGHVMVLLAHVGGDRWKVYDSNSGGGLTRIHVRSIRGFAVVNPHASHVAQL